MKKIIYCSLIIILALVVGFSWKDTKKADAVAGQLSASVATSSTITVTAGTLVTAFATSTCASRIVTTNAEPIRFEFSDRDGFTLTSAVGHTQLASTTVAYDASVYGCGHWKTTNAGPTGNTAIFQITETF